MRLLKPFFFVFLIACGPKPDKELVIGTWDLVSFQPSSDSDPMAIEPQSIASHSYEFGEDGKWVKGEATGEYSLNPKTGKLGIRGTIEDLGPYELIWKYELRNDSLTLKSTIKDEQVTNVYLRRADQE